MTVANSASRSLLTTRYRVYLFFGWLLIVPLSAFVTITLAALAFYALGVSGIAPALTSSNGYDFIKHRSGLDVAVKAFLLFGTISPAYLWHDMVQAQQAGMKSTFRSLFDSRYRGAGLRNMIFASLVWAVIFSMFVSR